MLCDCVGDVMDVVFSVCIVKSGTVGTRCRGTRCRCRVVIISQRFLLICCIG